MKRLRLYPTAPESLESALCSLAMVCPDRCLSVLYLPFKCVLHASPSPPPTVPIQVFGAPPEQPPGPDGSGSEPDQHRHEERGLRGAAPLAAPQPQVQAAAEGEDPPDGVARLPTQDVSGSQPQQKRKVGVFRFKVVRLKKRPTSCSGLVN